MTKTSIKNLPIEAEKEYTISILRHSEEMLLIALEESQYIIGKPKNNSWKEIEIKDDIKLIVKKVYYGDSDEFTKLDLIKKVSSKNTIQRKFKLPGIDDLNKDQDKVLRLPEDGQFLVVGGPGTGKSVVALLRAMKYQKSKNYTFLTFNKVLLNATKQLVGFNLNSYTLDSWFGKIYWRTFKENVPNQKNKFRVPDYDLIIKNLEDEELEVSPDHIIVDEGQDKPPKYYESLLHFGIENFFIVADQNQQITKENSTRQELTDLLGLEVQDVIELKENYRNSHPIGVLTSHFFTDPSSPLPTLPSTSKTSLGIPSLYTYSNYQSSIQLILREFDKDNRNLIGVIVATNELRESYVKSLQNMETTLDNPRATISTYSAKSKDPINVNFSNSGIVVLNDMSIKGLEFDIVFVIIDGFKIHDNDQESMKKRFYVITSRAIKKLVFFKSQEYKGGIEEILPTDETILRRERL